MCINWQYTRALVIKTSRQSNANTMYFISIYVIFSHERKNVFSHYNLLGLSLTLDRVWTLNRLVIKMLRIFLFCKKPSPVFCQSLAINPVISYNKIVWSTTQMSRREDKVIYGCFKIVCTFLSGENKYGKMHVAHSPSIVLLSHIYIICLNSAFQQKKMVKIHLVVQKLWTDKVVK